MNRSTFFGWGAGVGVWLFLLTTEAPALTITRDLADQDHLFAQVVLFSAEVEGEPPISFQWFKNGAPISGETNSTLALGEHSVNSGVHFQEAGLYHFEASNLLGHVTSRAARLNIHAHPRGNPGSVDQNFFIITSSIPCAGATSIAVVNNDRIIHAAHWGNGLYRIGRDGTVDPTFGYDGDSVWDLIPLADNGFVVTQGRTMERVHSDGTPHTAFNAAAPISSGQPGFYRAVVQPDGKVLVCGNLVRLNEVKHGPIVRLNEDGSIDPTFDPGAGPNATIRSIALLENGDIIVAGDFTACNNVPQGRLARLKSNGSLDETFLGGVPGADQNIEFVRVIGDSIIVAGSFTSIEDKSIKGLARLTSEGILDETFNAGPGITGGPVHAVIQQPDGKLIIGGGFLSVQGHSVTRVARLDANGFWDRSFDVGAGPDGLVAALALQPDGDVLIGGPFRNVAGLNRRFLARLVGGPPTLKGSRNEDGLELSWPATAADYQLEFNTHLTSSGWEHEPTAPSLVGDRMVVTAPMELSARFYRLVKQPQVEIESTSELSKRRGPGII